MSCNFPGWLWSKAYHINVGNWESRLLFSSLMSTKLVSSSAPMQWAVSMLLISFLLSLWLGWSNTQDHPRAVIPRSMDFFFSQLTASNSWKDTVWNKVKQNFIGISALCGFRRTVSAPIFFPVKSYFLQVLNKTKFVKYLAYKRVFVSCLNQHFISHNADCWALPSDSLI